MQELQTAKARLILRACFAIRYLQGGTGKHRGYDAYIRFTIERVGTEDTTVNIMTTDLSSEWREMKQSMIVCPQLFYFFL